MRGAFAIARHDLTERWLLWPLAFAVGLLPLLLRLLIAEDAGEILAVLAISGLVCASWVAALVIGMGLVGRPLHDGRLSFYFTRPISTYAIAGGKLLGGLVLILGTEVLLCAPLAARLQSVTWTSVALVFMPAAGCLGIGLIAGVLARSRSRWFLFDLGGLALFIVEILRVATRISILRERFWVYVKGPTGWDWQRPFSPWTTELVQKEADFYTRIDHVWLGLALAGLLALFIAAAASLASGRTDRERAHGSLSVALWSTLLVAGGGAVAVSQWGM